MLALSQFRCRGGLHSTGVTRLHRYTSHHPKIAALCRAPPFRVASAYSRRSIPTREPDDPPGSSFVSMYCSMPSATPGRETITGRLACRLCCLLLQTKRRPSRQEYFGATYRIQLLSLHLATFRRFLAFSFGWHDLALPGGIPTHTTKRPFPGPRLTPLSLSAKHKGIFRTPGQRCLTPSRSACARG